MRKAFVFSIAALLALALEMPGARAEDAFARGMRLYNQHQYRSAAAAFAEAERQNGSNAWIPYYLGNALMQLGDVSGARKQYERGYELGPGTILGVYCRKALDSIKPQPVAMINPPAALSRPYGTFSRAHGAVGHEHSHTSSSVYDRMIGPRPKGISHGEAGDQTSSMIGMETHSDGVPTLPQRPETGMPEQWRKWFLTFRHACEVTMSKIVFTRPGWQDMNGGTELYCSIDRNHKLRARIHESHADNVFNTAVLDTFRQLDGSPVIALPPGSSIDGFNFYFDWDARAMRRLGDMANLKDVHGNVQQNMTGLNASPNRLTVSGANRNVSATLQNKSTTASLRNNTSALTANQGKLRAEDVDADLINSQVAGKIIGGGASELHATQFRLPGMENVFGAPLGSIKTEVTGELRTPDGKGAVAGELKQPDAKTEVTGELKPPDAKTEVTGELKPPEPKP
ncbi:MAG: tetratricopeptide repeat protein, partial [Terriglobales bacterium]